jgi:methionine sulfoxide reductase heme-binding subunit
MWLASLAPAAWLGYAALTGGLGVNPIEELTHTTGMAALVILLVTLTVSPLRRLTGWNPLIQLRRPLGLFAFFYTLLHFSIWMVLDLGFQLEWVWEDIRERPYITAGFIGFVLMIPLAVTSTRGWIRRLGKRWTVLHRLVYLSAALGILHFYWRVKADAWLPVAMAVILLGLLAARVPGWLEARRRKRGRSQGLEGGGAGAPVQAD